MTDDYDKLLCREEVALERYKHFSIGKTEWGQDIYCYEMGAGEKSILLQGTIHAREYISSFVLFDMMDYISHFYLPVKLYFVPVVNKDGVLLCVKGNSLKNIGKSQKKLSFFSKFSENDVKFAKKLVEKYDISLLKSNGRGVDLNVNFDCDWGEGKHNFFAFPSYQNYIGLSPNSAKENKCLIALTRKVKPDITLSFHSRGEVFYYGYAGESSKVKKLNKKYKRIIKHSTGYKGIFTKDSTGGYKDWCIKQLSIPSFTIELGKDMLSHPISSIYSHEIFAKISDLVLDLSNELMR